MANNHYDAIVVGSGISGGWAVKELTEKGLKVLMLERGRDLEHIKDHTNAHKEVWDYPHRNIPTQQMKQDYPVLKRDFPLNEAQLGWWTDEQKSPYVEDKRFDWYRSYQMGGRSLLWGRQSYRLNKFGVSQCVQVDADVAGSTGTPPASQPTFQPQAADLLRQLIRKLVTDQNAGLV